jgi:hypothetical protein
MSAHAWAQIFGLSDEELSNWKSRIGVGEDLLRWCLVQGRIPESAYMRWASENYALPVVKQDYFSIAPDPIFWEAVRRRFKWTRSIMPLTEWQGVLMIACLEPPKNLPYRLEHRFVLATAAQLDRLWDAFHPNGDEEVSEVTKLGKTVIRMIDEPSKPRIKIPPPVAPATSLEPLETSQSSIALEMPDGIVSNQSLGAISILSPSPTKISESTTLPNTLATDAPAGLENFSTAPQANIPDGFEISITTDIVKGLDLQSLAAIPSALESRPAAPEIRMPPLPIDIPLAPPVAPTLNIRPMDLPILDERTLPPPKGEVIEFDEVTQTHQTPVSVSINADISPLDSAENFEDLATKTLGHVIRVFEHGVVFLFNRGQMRPWKWTELLLSTKGSKPDPIDLSTASIFRIVFRSCLPYHGFVIASPVNTKFFNEFHRGMLPKHVTLVPVIVKGKIAGMVMGISNVDVDYKKSLSHLERVGAEVGANLDRLGHQTTAAAS